MSTIQIQSNIIHLDSGMSLGAAVQQTTLGSAFVANVVDVTTTDEIIPLGDLDSHKYAHLKLISGDPVQLGLDGSTYPFMLAALGESMMFRMNVEGVSGDREVQTVTTVADVSDSLDGTYFVVEDVRGVTWAIGFGTLSHGEDYEISVAINTDDTAAAVAAALYAALVADDDFSNYITPSYDAGVDDDFITLTDNFAGNRTNIADTGSTGFTLATTNAGSGGANLVHMKSTGESQVAVAVAPI